MSKKIFIIEDDENILYGLQDHFTSDGYEVEISTAVEDIDELVSRLKKVKPDYIILDLLLPKIDGLEIVKKIRNDEETADIQVLIFTDLSEEDGKTRSIGLGINHYFLKSEMDISEFAEKVEHIIESRKAEAGETEEEENDLVME
jgi:DNA-binding response OmpR family regulator